MSRDRVGRRRYDEGEDGEGASSAAAAAPRSSRADADEAEAKAARKAARQAARAEAAAAAAAADAAATSASPPEAEGELDEDAARRARKAKRAAAREAERQAAADGADAASLASPRGRAGSFVTAPSARDVASKLDLLRDFERDADAHQVSVAPRFKRAIAARQAEEEEEAAAAAAAAAAATAAAAAAAKAKRRAREEQLQQEQQQRARQRSVLQAAEFVTPVKERRGSNAAAPTTSDASSKPRKGSAAAAASAAEEEEEADEADSVADLPRLGVGVTPMRPGGFSGASPAGSPSSVTGGNAAEWDSVQTRARVSSIVQSQKALDVVGLNKLLDKIPAVFFTRDGFNPFNHWNDRKDELEGWIRIVEAGVAKVVEAYHKGFNQATSSFSHVLKNFADSQRLVRQLQETLSESKRLLSARNVKLKEYHFDSCKARALNDILDKMRYVVEVPHWLDHFLARKQYVHLVVLLQHTLSLLVSEDLVAVDGLLELREEILVRKHFVQQFLLEELHRIIYAKEKDANAHLKFVNPNANKTQQYVPPENVLSFNAEGMRIKPTSSSSANIMADSNFSAHRGPLIGQYCILPSKRVVDLVAQYVVICCCFLCMSHLFQSVICASHRHSLVLLLQIRNSPHSSKPLRPSQERRANCLLHAARVSRWMAAGAAAVMAPAWTLPCRRC
jgi:hypothetical protein